MTARIPILLLPLFSLLVAGCGAPPGNGGHGETTQGAPPRTDTLSSASAARSEPPKRPANAEELALVAPLMPGQKLADWEVHKILGVEHGALSLVCEKGDKRVILSVTLASEGGPEPPASTERYAVFYSLRNAEPEDGETLAKALAEVLQKNQSAEPPKGLTRFVPRPRTL